MEERRITEAILENYGRYLKEEERSRNTIEKYLRDIRSFQCFLTDRPVSRQELAAYKEELKKQYAVQSINSMLSAINSFLRHCGWADCCVRQIRVQRQAFCPQEKELSRAEYRRLVEAARKKKNERLEMVLQTICATGIRISELDRRIFLPQKLRDILKGYIRKKRIRTGSVFITSGGRPWDRSNIWKEMKKLCQEAGVEPGKVFPHNLRHLFARTYYDMKKDIAKLADILGHSSINTTRIYTISTGEEHQRQIEELGLLI